MEPFLGLKRVFSGLKLAF